MTGEEWFQMVGKPQADDLPFDTMPKWAQDQFDSRGIARDKFVTWGFSPTVEKVCVILTSGVRVDFLK